MRFDTGVQWTFGEGIRCCVVVYRVAILFCDGTHGSPAGMRQRRFTGRFKSGDALQDTVILNFIS